MLMENSNDTIGNRTRAVPQPTAPTCAPVFNHIVGFSFTYHSSEFETGVAGGDVCIVKVEIRQPS